MDWTKTGYSYSVDVNVVHQTNVDNTLGSLRGVQLDNLSITENYYSDSRIQAKVTTVVASGESDGYIANARLRVILSIPEENWIEELITGYVSDIDEEYSNGYLKTTYTVEGTIWGLLNHPIAAPITIGKGSKLVNVWSNAMKTLTRMQYSTEGSKDHSFGTSVIYEAGTMLSTVLFELSSGYDRMNTNGHGVVTLTEYKAPSNMTPSRVLDYNDFTSLSIAPLSRKSEEYTIPGRAVVTATVSKQDSNGNSTQEVIVGYYDAPSTHFTSVSVRGFVYGRTDSYSGTSENPSKSELNSIAKSNWQDSQNKGIEWTGDHVFADFHAGEVVTLVAPTNAKLNSITSHKVLVSAVSTNLKTFVQSLTLKEV